MTPRLRIAAGIVLIVVAPLVWLAPIKSAYSLTSLVAGAVALYGLILIVLGLVEKRWEKVG